jgi:hypothetical protein
MLKEILLSQKDFYYGTYRIVNPGFYKLTEDIVFHPNPENNFLPRSDQGDKYPKNNGYFLGFFSVLTIECNDVILDLNSFTIEYSIEFNLKQRFGSIIELGSSPFIPKQGPGNFGNTFSKATNVNIKNGKLGRNPHHGIHGNDPEGLIISNLEISNFEVAGISINGGKSMQFSDIIIKNNSNINSLSAYSQCKFSIEPLKHIVAINKNSQLELNNRDGLGIDILKEVENEIINFENYVLNGGKYEGMFKNDSKLYDGNIYGIVLNTRGVVINEFKDKRTDDSIGNEAIFLKNIIIDRIISEGKESRVLAFDDNVSAYGKNVCKGFAGDVLDFNICCDENGLYNDNILSNVQLLINKYGDDKTRGTCNIPDDIYKWISSNGSIDSFVENMPQLYWVDGFDSMAHKMKGNIGLFISQGKNLYTENILINSIINEGKNSNTDSSQSIGIGLIGCEDLNLNDIVVTKIESKYGKKMDYYIK